MYTVEYHWTFGNKVKTETISAKDVSHWLNKLREYESSLGVVIYKSWKITRCCDNVVLAQWRHKHAK